VNPHLEFLLSTIYDDAMHPVHLADLKKYPITDKTIKAQKIRSVPPNQITSLLGFNPSGVTSALLFPFADPVGGFMDHVRVKVFPVIEKVSGREKKVETIKYLQPRASGVRVFFPVSTMRAACESMDPLYIYEGEKKAILMAQRFGHPTIGICGVEGWHTSGSTSLIHDFDHVHLHGRRVRVIPDGDIATNNLVEEAIWKFGVALEKRGAKPELLHIPTISKENA
jgi:hypothetical protein